VQAESIVQRCAAGATPVSGIGVLLTALTHPFNNEFRATFLSRKALRCS